MLERLPRKFRDRWKTALKLRQFKKFARIFVRCRLVTLEWHEVATVADIDRICSATGKVIDVALMGSERACKLGISGDCPVITTTEGVEGTILGYIHLSRKLHIVETRAQAGLREVHVSDHNRLWIEFFGPLAEYSSRVVIVDRYALKSESEEGLKALLRGLVRSGIVEVTIYAETGDRTVGEIRERLRRICPPEIQKMDVYMPRGEWFTKCAHDRHIRFDEFRACTIGSGLVDVLNGARSEVDLSYKYGDQMSSIVAKESKLRQGTSSNFEFTLDGNLFG